jgi:hypothetical protein
VHEVVPYDPAVQESDDAHTVSAVVVQEVVTAPEQVVQGEQGAVPALDHVEPATHSPGAVAHTMFDEAVHADVTAPEHVAQGEQGAVPVVDHVEPATQDAGDDAHTVSAVVEQEVVTAPEQVVQGKQGAVPALDHVEPATHSPGAAHKPVIGWQDQEPPEHFTTWPAGQLVGGVLEQKEQELTYPPGE